MAASSYTDQFPEPSHSRYGRGEDRQAVRPYYHQDTDVAPQEEFLAGPEGLAPVQSEARNHAFVSGLGAGKTAAGILRSVANAEQWNPGELGMIVAPTVPALKNAILPVMREFGLLDAWEYRGKGSEEPGIHTPSGSRIILESADNDRKIQRLRGPNLSWVWIDEAAAVSERAWEVLSGRLRVGQYRNAFVTTTPKGKNWVYERFYADQDRDVHRSDPYEVVTANGTHGVFGVPSWLNPHNPDDYIDRLDEEYEGEFFRQEVEGEFTKFDGLVYSWFDDNDHILRDDPSPDEYDEFIYGVDWGHGNPMVGLAVGRAGDAYHIVDEFYETRCTNDDLSRELEEMQDRWREGTVYCDPAEPRSIEDLSRDGFHAKKADNSVTPGIQKVSEVRDEFQVCEICQNVINEFDLYQYKDGGDSDDPLKQNDHAMDALRYAILTHTGPDDGQSGSGTW
ncbi:phage terminase large subunit [Natrinema sp. DC36]|uniref:PBSX family phage terminase large subunit n=1 Tax=Natrinema sp. DC36 TaxID=2878680 RepID=UPI001CF01FEE|nr:phage terminase large subunit [Natrinema sp. DC36]